MSLSEKKKKAILDALTASYDATKETDPAKLKSLRAEARQIQVGVMKHVILSDQHRGRGDGSDDFRRSKTAYHAALGYYHAMGHHLLLLGDVEELWEANIDQVVRCHGDTLMLENRFFQEARCTRFLGNHDEKLAKPGIRAWLEPFIGEHEPLDAMRIDLMDGEKVLAELFFLHGHQGKNYGWLAKFSVRHIWASIQALTTIGSGVPSTDFELQQEHERMIYEWVSEKNTKSQVPILVFCGHTHHPVFMSATMADSMREPLDERRAREGASEALALEAAALEVKIVQRTGRATSFGPNMKPWYFNSGCCSFWDGDITGLELDSEGVRLVRWPDDNGLASSKKVLESAKWAEILRR